MTVMNILLLPWDLQTILGEFSREQEKFVAEKKENKKQEEAAVAPWVGYNEEDAMKKQILALSSVSPFSLRFKECL